jgi:hypothetical protein
MNISILIILLAIIAGVSVQASAQGMTSNRQSISYRTVKVDGLSVFYREAGPANASTVLLLHGFPSSSRMWGHYCTSRRQVPFCRAGLFQFWSQQCAVPIGVRIYF